ncbi:hypothetical protein EJV47_16135 [Hymenobacter gummosus]|uniref:Uncharacterized protein n=1 Tax=Hymenobacter gummosus TaxID=1776032 RepID=A0A431U0P4_9BACT|nr:hypothetical protein [Hymenobacter gummosus]RTQ48499.1 hypothetical protein EJV47_16135 [Hymenobacter gummosus]
MNRLLLYAALLLLTQCSKCKDDPEPRPPVAETLPAETQTGANTFGCRLNGQVWTASPAYFSPTLTADYTGSFGQERLMIMAINDRPPVQQGTYFRLRGVSGPGRYPIASGQPCYVEFADDNRTCPLYDTLTSVQAGVVDITRLDRVQRVVSGRFSFTLRRAGCPDVQATDGRFDMRLP